MKNYLALHIDTDFLVGTICADEGNLSYPIRNGNDECFWLYFYNDPYNNNISFGKDNQSHCRQGETNYIGNFIELIEDKNNTFQIGTYEYPLIELLRFSKIIEKLKNEFSVQTHENQENISTLLTFSLSINELAKQTFVDYLKKQGFDIISYTIPLAELACKYAIMNNKLNFVNGNIVTYLEASNANMHLAKLIFTTDYFLFDGDSEPKQGLGIDPRRRALLKHIVNKIGTMGVLSEQEKEREYKLMEHKTIDWLNGLDMQINNAPFEVIEALSRMPNHKKRVLVYKNKISEFTQSDIKLIVDTYNDYVKRNITQDISAIVLLGNLFQNEIITQKFQALIPQEKLIVYSNKDIQNILSIYPKIDFNRYISEQGRIEAKAEAEKQKKSEELAKETAKAKAEKDAQEKAIADAKKEKDRQEAVKLYDLAVKLDNDGSFEDALIKVKDAIVLDPERTEYPRFRDTLNTKIKDLNNKTEKYKSWYKDAESYEQSAQLGLALKAYKNAQEIFDSAELRRKIVETESLIENEAKKKTAISELLSETQSLIEQKYFLKAQEKVNEILLLDKENANATSLLKKIEDLIQQQEKERKEKEIRKLLDDAESLLLKNLLADSEVAYKKVLSIDAKNGEATAKLEEINLRKSAPPPPPKAIKKEEPEINSVKQSTVASPPPVPVKKEPKPQVTIGNKGSIVPPPPVIAPPKLKSSGHVPPPPPKKK